MHDGQQSVSEQASISECLPAASLSGQQSHAETVGLLSMLHRLLREIVGLWEAVQGQAPMEAHRELGEQRHQDGFHHYHGNVLANAGSRAWAERLKVTTRGLMEEKTMLLQAE